MKREELEYRLSQIDIPRTRRTVMKLDWGNPRRNSTPGASGHLYIRKNESGTYTTQIPTNGKKIQKRHKTLAEAIKYRDTTLKEINKWHSQLTSQMEL